VIRRLPHKPRQFFDLFEEFGSGSIARLPKHQNGGFELHYIAEGHLHWEIEGRPFLVPPHSVFFTFPWEKHGSCVDFEPGHFFHFAVFRLKAGWENGSRRPRLVPGFGLSEPEQDQVFRKLLSARTRCFAAGRDLGWIIARLVRELAHPGVMARARVIALSKVALCELVEAVHSQRDRDQNISPSEWQVLRFVDDLRLNCSKPWTLDSMAAACRLKRTRFETLTKAVTGDSPLLLLNRFRIRQAQQLLKSGDRPITEIAFDSGFGSSQYFARVFQKLAGTSPSEYRRQQGSPAAYDQRFLKALTRLQKYPRWRHLSPRRTKPSASYLAENL
jgi:AraC family L-rhamnose operon regulatory protein RhaS